MLAFGLLAFQILVIDNLDLGAYFKPQILVVLALLFPLNLKKGYALFLAFTFGIIADFFLDTHGINAFSLTLVTYIRDIWLPKEERPREDFNVVPSLSIKLNPKWLTYVILLTSIYHFIFYTLEFFSLFFIFRILTTSILSTALCLVFQWILYLVFLRNKSSV